MIETTRVLATTCGAAMVCLSLQDAFEVVLLPRRVSRRWRLVRAFFLASWSLWRGAARWVEAGTRRDDYLSVYGPLSMVLLFALWALGLVVGFGLMHWGVDLDPAPDGSATLVSRLLMSGDAFFTLGYGDVIPRSTTARLLVILEAGTGFGFIALTIGYLPVLHQHFSDRDVQLVLLDARAGTPASGAGVLVRLATEAGPEAIDAWLAGWEVWAAGLVESHTSYPMLAFYRSQHRGHSWLASLALVLDCCTLLVAGGRRPPLQAACTFSAARRVLAELVGSLGVDCRGSARADRFPSSRQVTALAGALAAAGVPLAFDATGREVAASLRATYEPLLEALSAHLLLPLPAWRDLDHTVPSDDPRLALARRLTVDARGRPTRGG